MHEVFQLQETIPGCVIVDKKFNEVYVSLKILFPMEVFTCTIANVFAQLLSDRMESYPTKRDMMGALDALYGARHNVRTYGVGALQVLEITVRGINEKYTDEPLHQMFVDFVFKNLREPLINKQTLKEASINVRQQLLRLKEQPDSLAIFDAFKEAGKDQPFGINAYGELKDLEAITMQDVLSFHQSLMDTAAMELVVAGDVNPENINIPKITNKAIPLKALQKTKIEPRRVERQHDGNQTELVLVYETDITPNHPMYYAYLTYLAVLGQSASSLMFQNIREKESLCYSIYASQLTFDGLFYIATSINNENVERVLTLIDEQQKLIDDGHFDLDPTIKYLVNKVDGTSENLAQLADFEFRNRRFEKEDTIEGLIASFKKVTKDEVMAVSMHLGKPFVYVYRGENNEEDN